MIPLEVRLANFIDSVSFVADKDRQRLVWVQRAKGVSSVYSLGELYSQFFDDNEIDDFIDHEMMNAPLSNAQREAIRRFRDALNAFSGSPGKGGGMKLESALIDDPEWNELVELATLTKNLFP